MASCIGLPPRPPVPPVVMGINDASHNLGGLKTEPDAGRDTGRGPMSDEGSVPGVVNSGESSEDDDVHPGPPDGAAVDAAAGWTVESHPKGR